MTKEDNFDWDKFFKECELLVNEKRFYNLHEWLDKKGIFAIQKYKEEQKSKSVINNGRS